MNAILAARVLLRAESNHSLCSRIRFNRVIAQVGIELSQHYEHYEAIYLHVPLSSSDPSLSMTPTSYVRLLHKSVFMLQCVESTMYNA
jgi:hypothetical protein